MLTSDLIKNRRSNRKFLDKPVEKEKLDRILETSLRAPSWKNAQSYRILVVQGEARKKLSDRLV